MRGLRRSRLGSADSAEVDERREGCTGIEAKQTARESKVEETKLNPCCEYGDEGVPAVRAGKAETCHTLKSSTNDNVEGCDRNDTKRSVGETEEGAMGVRQWIGPGCEVMATLPPESADCERPRSGRRAMRVPTSSSKPSSTNTSPNTSISRRPCRSARTRTSATASGSPRRRVPPSPSRSSTSASPGTSRITRHSAAVSNSGVGRGSVGSRRTFVGGVVVAVVVVVLGMQVVRSEAAACEWGGGGEPCQVGRRYHVVRGGMGGYGGREEGVMCGANVCERRPPPTSTSPPSPPPPPGPAVGPCGTVVVGGVMCGSGQITINSQADADALWNCSVAENVTLGGISSTNITLNLTVIRSMVFNWTESAYYVLPRLEEVGAIRMSGSGKGRGYEAPVLRRVCTSVHVYVPFSATRFVGVSMPRVEVAPVISVSIYVAGVYADVGSASGGPVEVTSLTLGCRSTASRCVRGLGSVRRVLSVVYLAFVDVSGMMSGGLEVVGNGSSVTLDGVAAVMNVTYADNVTDVARITSSNAPSIGFRLPYVRTLGPVDVTGAQNGTFYASTLR